MPESRIDRGELEQAVRVAWAAGHSEAQIRQAIDELPIGVMDRLLLISFFVQLTALEPRPLLPGLPAEVIADAVVEEARDATSAGDLLEAILVDGGWHESVEVKRLLTAAGWSERTAQRAAKDLGVEAVRRGYPARTFWRFGATSATDADGATGVGASDGAFDDSAHINGSAISPDAPGVLRSRLARLTDRLRAARARGQA